MSVPTIITPGQRSAVGQEIVVANEIAFAAAAGQIPGLVPQRKFGRNPNSALSTEEDIWAQGGTLTWLTSASQLDVSSSDTNDDGAPTTNTGAQTITIQGLDSNFDEISETVTLNGTTAVTTTASFLRVNRAFVATVGTYHGTNIGDITIQVTGGGSVQASIVAGAGQTQKSQFTIPAGKTAYIVSVQAVVDGNKSGSVSLWQYQNADDVTQPYSGARRLVKEFPGVIGVADALFRAFVVVPEKTDLWGTIVAGSANTDATLVYNLAIQDN